MTVSGTVFQISTNGALTTLYSFGGDDGSQPYAGLVQGSDGNFYGTTSDGGTNGYGTVFKISTNGALTTLYSFGAILSSDYYSMAQIPMPGWCRAATAISMARRPSGGTNDAGTVFKISTNGALTSLYSFTGGDDGSQSLCRAGAGQRRQFLWHD